MSETETLFDHFDFANFYKEIKQTPEYQAEHDRLRPGFIKLGPGTTLIRNGVIKWKQVYKFGAFEHNSYSVPRTNYMQPCDALALLARLEYQLRVQQSGCHIRNAVAFSFQNSRTH